MKKLSSPDEAQRWLEKGMKEAAQRAIVSTAARLVSHIQTVVIPQTKPQPVDRGIYKAGWKFKALSDGAEVYNVSPHAPMVEYGVRAENVKVGGAIGPLTEWVKRKLRPGSKDTKTRKVSAKLIQSLTEQTRKKKKASPSPGKKSASFTDAQARRIAWAIALSMKKRGIFNHGKGLRVMERSYPMVKPFFSKELKREMKRMS